MARLERILLVDDDEDVRMVAQLALESIGGFTVLACGSAHQALAEATAFRPQLLLVDVMMPDVDGPALVEQLHRDPALAAVPAVFLTARAEPGHLAGYQQRGAVGVVAKPFDPPRLCDDVLAIWTRLQP